MMEKMLRTQELLVLLCLFIISANNCTQKPEIDNDKPEYNNTPIVGNHHNSESLDIDSGLIVRTTGFAVNRIKLDHFYYATKDESLSGIDQDGVERIEWKGGDTITLYCNQENWEYVVDYIIDSTAILNDGKYSYARIIPSNSSLYLFKGFRKIYAQYPSSRIFSSGSFVNMTGSIPKNQTGVIDMNYINMYYDSLFKVDNDGYLEHMQLDFEPMFTVLEFTISACDNMALSNVTLSSANGYLSGPFTASFRLLYYVPEYRFSNNESAKEVTVDLNGLECKEVGKDKFVTFAVLAPANDIEGLSLRFEMADSMGTRKASTIKNPDGTDYMFAGGMKHKIRGIELWVDTLALKDETGTYEPLIDRPYIDFSADTEGLKNDDSDQPVKFPISSYMVTIHMLTDDNANEQYIKTFQDAIKSNKKIYFYIRYSAEPNQWYYWLNLELLGINENYSELQYLLKKEVFFNALTDRRIKYQEKIPITEEMINRLISEYSTRHYQGLFTLRGGNVTIDGAYITIED